MVILNIGILYTTSWEQLSARRWTVRVSYITERTFIRGMQQQENMLEYANDSSQLSEIIKFYTIRLPATMT